MAHGDTAPRPDTDAAVAFLHAVHAGRPVHLTAISAATRLLLGRTFAAAESEDLRRWLDEKQGLFNIYFSINALRYGLGRERKEGTCCGPKAAKTDVARMHFVHVDLDPKKGETPDEAKARAQALLDAYHLSPSIVVDSGGGLQALWALVALGTELDVNGDIDKAHELERVTRQLEIDFGIDAAGKNAADHCFNIDRIFRVPGTVNVPNKKKQAAGRMPALARVLKCDLTLAYELGQFGKAPPLGVAAGTPGTPARQRNATQAATSAAGWGQPISAGTEELRQWAAANGKTLDGKSERALACIATGDAGEWAGDRSAMVFFVCAELDRAGLPPGLIASAIYDKANPICAHIWEKGGRDPWAYAQRQVLRAQESTANDEAGRAAESGDVLAEMNAQHAVLTQEGGKVRVLCWEASDVDETRLVPVLQSFEDFRNRYLNQCVAVGTSDKGTIYKKLGHWWLEHRDRRQYKGLRLMPGRPAEHGGYLNLWRGWGVEPAPGDWSLMRAHIEQIVAQGNDEHASYILRWVAWGVQHPDEPAEVALVLRGRRGTGKGAFASALCAMFGQHGLQISQPSHLTGKFNAHLRECCLLFADEALVPGDKASESALKVLITEHQLTVEGKHVNAIPVKNRLKIVMSSNEDWVVPAGLDERRFAAFDIADTRAQDHDYFSSLKAQLMAGGLGAMLHDLLAMDLGRWHPRQDVPETDALLAQKAESLFGVEAVMLDLLRTGSMPGLQTATAAALPFVATHDLHDYVERRLRTQRGLQKATLNDAADLLEDLGARTYRLPRGGKRGYLLGGLADMRERWNTTRVRVKWNGVEDWSPLDNQSALRPGPAPYAPTDPGDDIPF
jgi:hypothetical protein